MSTRLVYLDTETTGLDPNRHEVWEIAYAIDDGPIRSSVVAHKFTTPDPAALRVNGYLDRTTVRDFGAEGTFEADFADAVRGATIVGANPAFDASFLRERWGNAPWHYRLIDVESYAMGALSYDRPRGLATIAADLTEAGFPTIPAPDHTAAGDVATLRACYLALADIYRGAFTFAHIA